MILRSLQSFFCARKNTPEMEKKSRAYFFSNVTLVLECVCELLLFSFNNMLVQSTPVYTC